MSTNGKMAMFWKKSKNPYVYASLTVLVLMMVVWLFGRVMATSDNTYLRVLLLQDVVNQVSMRYVEHIPPDRLYHQAVEGLLKGLDPYTELIPRQEYERFQELQVRSEYVGTGMSVSSTNQEIVVMSTFPGSSAYRQGVRPGDRIVRIGGKPTTDWSTEQVSLGLLGTEGSQVEVTLARPGAPEPVVLNLTRQPIVVPTVTRHFLLPGGVGYLRLSSFTERSAAELRSLVQQLLAGGMKSLVLDLRDNTGGLTDSAVEICDMFLEGRQLIVAMRGRTEEDSKSYFSTGKPVFRELPIALLINEFSASSSEIVAGALQDHDRAVLVGRNSFGKGLVQTTYPLSSGDVLKITTARYYTPSGRNIQREVYRPRRELEQEVIGAESTPPKEQEYKTDMGRPVQGGGGISPDVEVERKEGAFDPLIARLVPYSFDFAVAYKSMHPELPKSFRAGPQVFQAFLEYLRGKGVPFDAGRAAALQDYISIELLTYHIAQISWDESVAYQSISEADPQLVKAAELLRGARDQKQILTRIMQEEKAN